MTKPKSVPSKMIDAFEYPVSYNEADKIEVSDRRGDQTAMKAAPVCDKASGESD